ncbi:hypothetical protein ASAP_1325 [Asaia bogorensis]|uniref:Uncharacterized protein n=1 Tax=Asaia bogorensis TaxID=91915 RepID=A0A060QEK9_9PROT|nr:hypothetical protein ASAP_1325 [Asaia bogorensis]
MAIQASERRRWLKRTGISKQDFQIRQRPLLSVERRIVRSLKKT